MDKSRRSPQMVAARVGDMGSIHINADLVFNGAAYTPTGQNAYFECITNAGTSVRVQAQKSGSTVSVDIPSQALCKPGVITCAYFRFENGTTENPTFVESTQSFGIIVPTSIDDNIDAEDYLGDWRELEQQLQGYVDEVSAAATQAKKDISSDTSAVDSAKSSAISAINADKQEVADAAANVMKPINDVLDQFNEDSQSAIDSFNTKGTNAVSSFNTKGNQAVSTFNANGTQKIREFDDAADTKLASVDSMISQAQEDVNADIAALQKATQEAIDAMEAALSEDQYGEILQRLNRVWKLSHQDMTAITNGQDLNSFKSVGCYVCKTDKAALSLRNKPEDLGVAFFLYVLSIQTTGSYQYYTQLIIPYTPQAGKMKFFTRAFDLAGNTWGEWAEVGSGADITAGDGIIVTGDGTKQVALDTDAFHESIKGAELASFDTSVTGGGSVQEMTVYGNTVQNLWVNPSGTSSGVTVTSNADGSLKLSGTASGKSIVKKKSYVLVPGKSYCLSIDSNITDDTPSGNEYTEVDVVFYSSSDRWLTSAKIGYGSVLSATFSVPANTAYSVFRITVKPGDTVSGTYRIMLNEGSEAEPWCPPGLNSVGDDGSVKIVTAGKNLASTESNNTVSGGITFNTEFDGSISAVGTATLTYPQRINVMNLPSNTDMVASKTVTGDIGQGGYYYFIVYGVRGSEQKALVSTRNADEAAFNTGEYDYWFFTSVAEGNGVTFDCKLYPQLELGSTATGYEPPNITTTPIDLQGHTLNSLPDGTRDELHIDGGGNVVLEKRTQTVQLDGDGNWDRFDKPFIGYQTHWQNFGGSPTGENTNAYADKLPFSKVVRNGLYSANPNGTNAYLRDPVFASDAAGVKEWMSTNKPVTIMPLLEPQTIDLGKISLSSVSSDQLNVWVNGASGGTGFTPPVTVDVVANKVDYRLPQPVDLSSKEDAFDVLPVSKGGTGTTSAQAERNRLGLGNTTGALPIANGGTSSTSAANARSALGITPANIGAAPASHTHNYAGSTSAGGAATSANKVNATSLADVDLNDYRTRGTFYYGAGRNGCTNKPSGVDAFGMVVMRTAGGYYVQLLHGIDDDAWFFRQYGGGAWTAWNRLYSTNSKPTLSELGAAASSHSHDAGNITSGMLPVARGGTGVTSAQAERNRLGLGNTTGALPIANGGTGATSASNAANAILGGITGSTNTLGSTAEFFIDDGGVPSRLEYLTLVSDISARLLGNSESNAKVKFLTVENVGGTLAGVASNIYEFINDCDNDGNEFLCLAKFTAIIAGQKFNVGLVGRLEKDLSNGGPTIYMSGIGWPTSVDSTSDNDAGLLLVHAFTNVTSSTMGFTINSLYFLGIKSTVGTVWPPASVSNAYCTKYNSSNFSFNRMLLFGYDSKMVV